MRETPKRPIIVICSIKPEMTPHATEWLKERNLLRAERVFPKGEKNLGPVTVDRIVAVVLNLQKQALAHHSSPKKFIIICDDDAKLRVVRQHLSEKSYYSAKCVEYHLIAKAGEVHPSRVGFFIL